jgi:hypothetical protein
MAVKTVVSDNTNSIITTPQAILDKTPFEDIIDSKGYSVYVEHMVECPCCDMQDSMPLPSCLNCGGAGRIWIDKTKTNMKCTSMGFNQKYQTWDTMNMGMVSLSYKAKDKLGYMDKVTLIDVETWFTQRVQLKKNRNLEELFGFLIYPPILVYDCYLFVSDEQPLKPVLLNEDFTLRDKKIILNSTYNNGL